MTTAGETLLTMSSSLAEEAAVGVDGGVPRPCAGGGVIGSDCGEGGVGWGSVTLVAMVTGGLGAGAVITAWATGCGAGRVSHQMPPASTTTKAAAVRAKAAAPLVDDGTGSAAISGAEPSDWVTPHRQVANFRGTRR